MREKHLPYLVRAIPMYAGYHQAGKSHDYFPEPVMGISLLPHSSPNLQQLAGISYLNPTSNQRRELMQCLGVSLQDHTQGREQGSRVLISYLHNRNKYKVLE
jgi:hypothetical protein